MPKDDVRIMEYYWEVENTDFQLAERDAFLRRQAGRCMGALAMETPSIIRVDEIASDRPDLSRYRARLVVCPADGSGEPYLVRQDRDRALGFDAALEAVRTLAARFPHDSAEGHGMWTLVRALEGQRDRLLEKPKA